MHRSVHNACGKVMTDVIAVVVALLGIRTSYRGTKSVTIVEVSAVYLGNHTKLSCDALAYVCLRLFVVLAAYHAKCVWHHVCPVRESHMSSLLCKLSFLVTAYCT